MAGFLIWLLLPLHFSMGCCERQDGGRSDPFRYVDRERSYRVSESPPRDAGVRFQEYDPPGRGVYDSRTRENEELLGRFLDTQDPRYYNADRYPEKKRPDVNEEDGRIRDGTPPGFRTDFIPSRELINLLFQADTLLSQQCTSNVDAQWAFETNINEATQLQALEGQLAYTEAQIKIRDVLCKIPKDRVRENHLWRAIRFLSVIGIAALPRDQLDRYNRLINDMLAVYNGATTCSYKDPLKCNLRLEPDLTNIMAKSKDWDELQHTWIEWHRRSGQKIRDLYDQMVDLSNYAARLNNFTDYYEYLSFPYESPSFRLDVEDAWAQIKPLYDELHAYVRRKLRDLYGPEKLGREAPMPAHILGNMWAQSWTNILDVTIPYPGKTFVDVTPQMNSQGYTPLTMFRLAEEFFLSLNLSGMPPDFWAHSLLQEPPDRPVICQPSAWDFCNRRDYRIKMCTRVTMKDLVTIHHEMTHIQYFLEYRNKPKVFRDGANPGFHEAVSEAIAMSAGSPKHLRTLGLVFSSNDDIPHNINYLYSLALDKLPFLAFSLALDSWRWDVFQGAIPKERYNCQWWDYREKIGGIKPPVLRSETDFDPGSKYHVPANIPYIRYFVSTVLQFQIFRGLCRAAVKQAHLNPSDPLYKCDVYRSSAAGNVLANLMSKGSSQPWQEVLQESIGESRLDGGALRDFFAPLEEWLRNENLRTGETVGWLYDGDYCKHSIETANLQVLGGFYNSAPKNEVFGLAIFLFLIVQFMS
ncbi:angiotensin-converting enzyme-like isoform X1 [Cimex lectularius]|uniref:Angiotensin-converting enzyme n=2 Tax=Cimex lectularius TaxID=79782 RepID=A0A8I6SLA4_CIMLE|nr:angiotensin-converting enzyme-like isoform X1 [Cimex lectularius]XP_024084385.1 angiotensin-converting enzyme-like isoform X1 [Cimex lectularius]